MRYLRILNFTLLASVLLAQCAKKGNSIYEPNFGTYNFTTYTVDTFRFKIIFNGETLTDSLLSPIGFYSKSISFLDPNGRLQVIDAGNNNQVILDTLINMKTGAQFFSLVQLLKGQKPYIPAPPVNEPLPGPAQYKLRFQYTPFIGETGLPPQPFFYDSVTCIIRKNGVVIDTVVLQKYGLTPFYEAGIFGGGTFTMIVEDPSSGAIIDEATSPTIGATFTGFNTVSVSGARIDDWRLLRMY